MRQIPSKIFYLLVPLLAVGVFLIDSFFRIIEHFDFNINLSFLALSLQNFRIIMVIALIAAWIIIVRRRFEISELELSQKLWRFSLLLFVNYVIAYLLKDIILADYLIGDIDRQKTVLEALVHEFYKNIIGLMTIVTLVPILFVLRDLIFYRQRRTTRLYFNLFLGMLLISTIWVSYTGETLDFLSPFADLPNAGSTMNIILVWSSMIVILLLAFRNDWITYLPRKQKFIYFGIGVVVYLMIIFLRDDIYEGYLGNSSVAVGYLQEYSFSVYNFAIFVWLLLLIYATFSMVTLLMHLPTAKAVDRKLKELTSLYDFARLLNTELNAQKLPQLITQLTSKVLESQSTWYMEYRNPVAPNMKLISHINLTQQQILDNPFEELNGLNQQLLDEKKPILINDISQNRSLRHLLEWKKDARTLIAAPLFSSRDQIMGVVYAAKPQPFGFDVDDLSLLEGFANQSAMALENAQLWNKSLEKERMEQELKIARDVQLKLVPQSMPLITGFELESFFLTAYEVGGDYYDFIEFGDEKTGVVIGDVSGKGTSAAFYMAEFKGVIQTLSQTLDSPKELICHANRIFYSSIEKQSFVTAVVGKFIPEKRTFQFVRAGHTPILHCSPKNKTVQYLQPPGLGIGLDKGPVFEKIIAQESITLDHGDFLILSTDGLMEARNASGDEYGEERLQELISHCHSYSAAGTKDRILTEVMDFIGETPLHDDLTFIVIKFGQGMPELDAPEPADKKTKQEKVAK